MFSVARCDAAPSLEVEEGILNQEQSGLTEAGAALVALVTAVATGGMDFNQLLTSGALSGAKATAFNAGMQALTVHASVALVNNKGDIGATLKQLASTCELSTGCVFEPERRDWHYETATLYERRFK